MCGSKDQTSTTSQTYGPPDWVVNGYKNIFNQAGNVAQTPYNPATGRGVAGLDPGQSQAIGAIRGAQGIAMPYLNQASSYATAGAAPITGNDIASYQNPWTDQVVNSTIADFAHQNAQNGQTINSNAAKIGALTGDRSQVAQQIAQESENRTQNPVLANLRAQGFNTAAGLAETDKGRQGNAAYTFGNLGNEAQSTTLQGATAALGAAGLNQQQQQAVLDAQTGNAKQKSAYPMQMLQWLAGIQSGVGSLSGGSSSGTQTTPGPNPFAQGVGGLLALASMFADGGAVRARADGGIVPYDGVGYVPQTQIVHGAGPQMGAAPAAPTAQPGADFAKMLGNFEHAKKAFSNVGEKLRTTTDPASGWATTVNPSGAQGWGNYLSNVTGGLGGLGFADGGEVDGGSDLVLDPMGPDGIASPEDVEDPFGGGGFPAIPSNLPVMASAGPAQPSGVAAASAQHVGTAPVVGTSPYGPPAPVAAAGVAPAPVQVATQDAGLATALAPESSGLFGLGLVPDNLRQPLMAAGLGMLASHSHNFGNAVGEGGLAGLQTYRGQKKQEAAQNLAEAKIHAQAAKMGQAAEIAQKRLEMASEALKETGRHHREAEGLMRQRLQSTPSMMSPSDREALAVQYGMDPQSDAFRSFVLTGRMPREDQQSLTATDKKAILDADEKTATTQNVLNALGEAEKLNDKAYGGWFSGTRASIGNNMPDWMVPDRIASPGKSEDTANLENAVIGQALTQLKMIFGGNPTEGERKILLDIQGSIGQPANVRKEIFARARQLATARQNMFRREAEQLRGGTFYKPGGGMTGGQAASGKPVTEPGQSKIQDQKTLNGNQYFLIDGQWYEQ